jgi:hypothetical protein
MSEIAILAARSLHSVPPEDGQTNYRHYAGLTEVVVYEAPFPKV